MRRSGTTLALVLLLARAAPGQTVATPPDTVLQRLLLEHRLGLTLANGKLSGRGAELLVAEGRRAQFFLIGEEHGVAETPVVIGALLRDLRPMGYDRFAIEVSPLQASRFNGLRGHREVRRELDSMFATWLNAAPFYTMRTEADLLGQALTREGTSGAMTILGLDYDVMGDRYWLRRLADMAPHSGKDVVARAVALADSGFARVVQTGDPSQLFAWSAGDSVFAGLWNAVHPSPGSEGARIIDVFHRTSRINRAFLAGENYKSNAERAGLMRENLINELARNRVKGQLPRIVFKFGAFHMMRGFTGTRVIDLGTSADVLAAAEGKTTFNVLIVGGAEARHAQMNITRLEYEPASGASLQGPEMAWVNAATPASGWVVFDLRPVRAAYFDTRGRTLTAAQERQLMAFDAIVVLTGSTPNQGLPARKE